ncbi:hypothetical protein [Brevibacterium litoralis]|uniref:hypothetical protein n=1 Tax=Brevibacterium litoralis TaxID=3138935 RepID=UPI0032EC2ADD
MVVVDPAGNESEETVVIVGESDPVEPDPEPTPPEPEPSDDPTTEDPAPEPVPTDPETEDPATEDPSTDPTDPGEDPVTEDPAEDPDAPQVPPAEDPAVDPGQDPATDPAKDPAEDPSEDSAEQEETAAGEDPVAPKSGRESEHAVDGEDEADEATPLPRTGALGTRVMGGIGAGFLAVGGLILAVVRRIRNREE